MAGFMRQHPDDLVRGLGLHHRAVVHENAAAVGDKGVEGAVVDDDDLDVLLFQTRGAQDRPGVFAQQLLGLGIADDRRALFLLRSAGDIGAMASAAAVVSAVSFEAFLRSARRSNMAVFKGLAAGRIRDMPYQTVECG